MSMLADEFTLSLLFSSNLETIEDQACQRMPPTGWF